MVDDNDILAHVGALGVGEENNGVAMSAVLRHLIESGKVSVDDAKAAVHAVQEVDAPSLSTDNNGGKTIMTKQSQPKKKDKPKSQKEKYRTRHVALQFSYDGTDYTGFAQNVGKENDNSIEKTLFGALEKTRLLVRPDEHGMLVMNEDEEKNIVVKGGNNDNNDKMNGEKDIRNKGPTDDELSARTAAQYSRCGRTDKGVHAHGQVVALYLKSAFPLSARLLDDQSDDNNGSSLLLDEDSLPKNSLDGLECLVPPKSKKSKGGNNNAAQKQISLQRKTITEYDYPRILNNVLPPSIRILGWCPVSSQFSARFSCSQRTYRYFFPRRNLDLSAMAEGLQYMMGRHDFRNLCKMNCEQVYNFERVLMKGKVVSPQKIYSVSMDDESSVSTDNISSTQLPSSPHDMCYIEIVGQAFLWHQIRCIMSILFYIGRKLESPTLVQQLFDIQTNPAKPSYEMASDSALVLQDCKFNHLNLGRTVQNMWNVTKVLEQRWEEHAVAAERANDEIESIKNETDVRWTDVVEFVTNIAKDRSRKEKKRINKVTMSDEGEIQQALEKHAPESTMIAWGSAVKIIEEILDVYPHPHSGSNQKQKGQTESSIHVPIMERSKGTTYEEKVQSIMGVEDGVSKRKHRYEENIIKKRKTTEEDKAFYEHMLRQGGSSL